MCIGLYVKCPFSLSDFNETRTSLTCFKKKDTEISNFMKIRQVGAELFYADGRTDGYDEADSRFSRFSERA